MKTKDIIIEHFREHFGMIRKNQLSLKTNCKTNSISIHLKELKDLGYINIIKNKYYIINYEILRTYNCDSCNKKSLLKRVDDDNVHYICFYCYKTKIKNEKN